MGGFELAEWAKNNGVLTEVTLIVIVLFIAIMVLAIIYLKKDN